MSFASHFMLNMREKSHYFWLRYSHVSLYNMSCQLPARYNIRRRIQSADLSAIGNVSRDERRYEREGERERRTPGRQHRVTAFQVEKSSLILFSLFICCCSAGWTGRMINGMWNNHRCNGQEAFISMKENCGRKMPRSLVRSCWTKGKRKKKKVWYLIQVFCSRTNSSFILELKSFQTQRTPVRSLHRILESDVSFWSSMCVFRFMCLAPCSICCRGG